MENVVEPDRQHITVWYMCFACWIVKATDTQITFHGNNGYANALQCYISTYTAVFSTSDFGRKRTRCALCYTSVAYLSERHQKKEKKSQFPWDSVTN